MKDHNGKGIFKLGFGLMRLPKLADRSIDVEQVKEMADLFIEAGGTYFDTAYVYDNGASEEAFRKAVVERYPRESFTVATKLNAWHGAKNEQEAKQQFFTSLERTGAGYFDFYLLHALQESNFKLYDDYHIWDFVKEQYDKGLIRHWGFSFHGTPGLLDELLTLHPDAAFVQLQINYADWDSPSVESGKCYEVARKHGKPVVIMEPVKGGGLANPPASVLDLFRSADPDASAASWAVRYAASLPGVLTVLSGMSNVEQMKDNLSYMKDFKPLTEEEHGVIAKAQDIIRKEITIPCTACSYCTDGCPMSIPIPDIFKVANDCIFAHKAPPARGRYARVTQGKGKASDCVECGQCENACPQHLPIITLLKGCLDMEG